MHKTDPWTTLLEPLALQITIRPRCYVNGSGRPHRHGLPLANNVEYNNGQNITVAEMIIVVLIVAFIQRHLRSAVM